MLSNKRKKPTQAAPGQKQPRKEYEDAPDLEDENSDDGDQDSDYGAERKKTGLRKPGGDLKNYKQNLDAQSQFSDDHEETPRPQTKKRSKIDKQMSVDKDDEEAKLEEKNQKAR